MAADRAKISVPLTLNPDDQSGGERVGLRAQPRRRSSPVGFFIGCVILSGWVDVVTGADPNLTSQDASRQRSP